MISELQLRWALWAFVVFISLQCLLSMATLLRDRLQDLLIAHVKRAQIEAQKRRRINELREKIRAKKAQVADEYGKELEKIAEDQLGSDKKAA